MTADIHGEFAFWVGTSWKMNKTRGAAREYMKHLLEWTRQTEPPANLFVLPPFPSLAELGAMAHGSRVLVGAQNIHWETDGAFTGEVSADMVRDCGASLVELGHLERRIAFGETDEIVGWKVRSALACGLRPLVCVGESASDRAHCVGGEVVARQVKVALHAAPRDALAQLLVAYEPGWAIGREGVAADPEHVGAMHALIRAAISELHDEASASAVPVLYGGSVSPDNAAHFAATPGVSGLFVGRAGLDVTSFLEVVELSVAPQRSPSRNGLEVGS